MIQIGDQTYTLGDPVVMLVVAGAALGLLIVILLIAAVRAAGRSARVAAPLAQQIGQLGQRVEALGQGQQQLAGGLTHVSEAQAAAQANMLQLMERRLGQVSEKMNENLQGAARRTAHSLGELQQRLQAIDKAQDNITKLSGDVLSLQDILSNKQTRGAFGEIQLRDIVSKALPSDSYQWQATLSNGKRADCLIYLPNPPGPIAIDSKFPLEPYEALVNAESPEGVNRAATQMRQAVRAHIKAISEKYILDGETADGALMFLPSEAVYAELHARFPELVREGFAARVWIVSPTTCMATLHTMRAILKDARMREQAGAIRRELGLLFADVERLGARVDNLDRHFGQAAKDISEIKISADKAGRRARRLDNFDFEELAPETEAPGVLRLEHPKL
ncbi:DNA recombination protein RmuC [Lutimaribacter sp. EGI FJ00015]|uniref:DNA recombination protein RmuC n=1 Tax=Lutimaribacter degradans TaxID=2945989 RepID=A0ACC5ZXX8_9RHOB|nr:DNA recombination protein RmuC [Lutimaribacter sp. EGI FJ00013]MCM2562773.1 DNA recombination protein RmuC [Lutimaribacter sp. EGI FJ00013]MCO0613930.1 DNA recombination protein RmuC [Lutimaribacter sp. EGI FJ00015]MCO0636902.1 DNA recombination protein RmuC [Lutimaribacter sp. EGI FJ00014]